MDLYMPPDDAVPDETGRLGATARVDRLLHRHIKRVFRDCGDGMDMATPSDDALPPTAEL
jgi:hypothetical protein